MLAARFSTMRARCYKTRTKPSRKRARLQAQILPKILRAFQEAMPNVHVRLHDWSNNAILDGIRDGRLQLGLIVPSSKASALHDVRYQELFNERVCVTVAPRHPFARRRTVPIAEVA